MHRNRLVIIFLVAAFFAPAVYAAEQKGPGPPTKEQQRKEEAKAAEPHKLTGDDCADDVEGYCWWDLAVQNKDFSPCGMYSNQAAFMECFNSISKIRKPGGMDCEFMRHHKDLCLKLVEDGKSN